MCPDVSANGMIDLCKEQGNINTIPDIPGLVVWKTGHIGVYIGGGYTIEMRGFAYDCQRRKVKDGPWTKWGRLPASMISYGSTGTVIETPQKPAEKPVNPSNSAFELTRVLKRGCKGNDVKQLQEALMKLGYKLPKYGADGDFGSETEAAVKQFQKDYHLTVDGEFGTRCLSALTLALSAQKPAVKRYVKVTGGAVYVRTAPNTNGRILGIVHTGDKLPYQGEDSKDGWHLVEYSGQNAWISGKYSSITN